MGNRASSSLVARTIKETSFVYQGKRDFLLISFENDTIFSSRRFEKPCAGKTFGFGGESMTNILLEGYEINAPWLFDSLKDYIRPFQKVVIIALAFRDTRVKNLDDWNALYEKDHGCYYSGIVGSLADYGIPESQIEFINYFADTPETANQKIRNADILYFPGGLPDRMMERIREMQIYDSILHHEGIILGYSAGAVIQLRDYHLSPDKDYPKFAYYSGFPFIDDFYLEVHYEGTPEQNASIKRILREKHKPVYATHFMNGAIIVDNGTVKSIGKVSIFDCQPCINR